MPDPTADDQPTLSPTARDLLRLARQRHESVPLLLAVTLLVETLDAVRRRGLGDDPLTLERIRLTGAPPEALLDDPTRDPKVKIADSAGTASGAAETLPDVYSAGACVFELLTGSRPVPAIEGPIRDDLPDAAERLIRGLLAARPEDRPAIDEALAAAREIGLELFAAWDRRRAAARLEEHLRLALESRRQPEVRQLAAELADVAPASAWLDHARRWLEIRDRDARQETAARQLREETERRARRQAEARKVSLKLLLTGAPLILATLLTGLLLVVVLFSG